MVKNISGLLVMIIVLACTNQVKENKGEQIQEEPKTEIDASKALYVKFNVKGMTCEGCENAVTKNIEKLEGIGEISISHQNEYAKVLYDSSLTNIDELSNAITESGYSVVGHQELEREL